MKSFLSISFAMFVASLGLTSCGPSDEDREKLESQASQKLSAYLNNWNNERKVIENSITLDSDSALTQN